MRICVVCRTALLRLALYRYLVGDAGADKDLADADGQTALHYAVGNGRVDVVKYAAESWQAVWKVVLSGQA